MQIWSTRTHDNETKRNFTSKEQVAETIRKPAGTEFEVLISTMKFAQFMKTMKKLCLKILKFLKKPQPRIHGFQKTQSKPKLRSSQKKRLIMFCHKFRTRSKEGLMFPLWTKLKKKSHCHPRRMTMVNNSLEPQETSLLKPHSDNITAVINNVCVFICTRAFVCALNRPFPSSLLPLFQNESKCETFHMKMSFTHKSIQMQIILIFI